METPVQRRRAATEEKILEQTTVQQLPGIEERLEHEFEVSNPELLQASLSSVSVPGGQLKYFKRSWASISNDATILNWVTGYKIPFRISPYQSLAPVEPQWSTSELHDIPELIVRLKMKGVVSECNADPDQFISNIFLVPKTDGTKRLILNLKKLNEFIDTVHFKLEDLEQPEISCPETA